MLKKIQTSYGRNLSLPGTYIIPSSKSIGSVGKYKKKV